MNFRKTMRLAAIAVLFPLMGVASPVSAGEYHITVDPITIDTGDFKRPGIGYNGTSPGPVLRFKEGEDVTIHVTNNLDVQTSIHWHGLILPFQQDGVPGMSFDGIEPGETFTYNFPIQQAGTYWYHSHSGFQEPDGAYGAIVIEPEGREPFRFDREHTLILTDAHPHRGDRIMRNLKLMPDYYNQQQRTLMDFFSDVEEKGFGEAMADRSDWGDMRMMPTDIEDVQGYTALINGKNAEQNWTALFEPGERVRLRFINASAMSYFDIRIPGLEMLVVQSDGNNVQPVKVDEFRLSVAETYDVIVRPRDDKAFSIIAESVGRTAMGRATLSPREGMVAELPALREPPLLTMADMNHASMGHEHMDHGSMDHSAMGHGGMTHTMPDGTVMDGASHEAMGHGNHGMMDHGAHTGHGMAKGNASDPFYAPGSGLMPVAAKEGGKFLSYADLKAQKPLYEYREPDREIELRLTGNMERYSWSMNGIKFDDAEPIRLQYGERVRFKFINETMMTHPMHLHGLWSILDNGNGQWNPIKHVISVAPNTTVYMETVADAPGEWAFHCHLAYHAKAGMFRKVIVEGGPDEDHAALSTEREG